MTISRTVQSLFHLTSQIMSKFNVVFVLGGPGAGKGTQCSNIVKDFGYVHLSAGDLLREERQRGGHVAEMIETHIRNGTIVPVEVTCGLLNQAMVGSGKQDFLIDGFPRNENNLQGWKKDMDDKTDVKFVLFFDCSEEVCVQRCLKRGQSSGRSDDNEESLRKRIVTYTQSTMPVISYYDTLGLVKRVDAAGAEDEVFEQVKKLFS